MKKIEMEIECSACQGSGIYVGMGERDGAAVVCYNCNGSGKYNYKFEYNEFTGLKKKKGVKRVYKSSYGYVISPEVIDFKDIGQIDMSKEGVSYEDFVKGMGPDHIKKLVCPMIANQ